MKSQPLRERIASYRANRSKIVAIERNARKSAYQEQPSHKPYPMPPTIQPSNSDDDRETVFSWLREFNHSENGQFMRLLDEQDATPVFLVARCDQGNVVGGLTGETFLDWLKVNIMAVHSDHRRQGIGSELLAAAEEHARSQGCLYSYVDSMSHQAPNFYLGNGYQEVGRLPNWDSHGHDKFFFTKPLT